MRFSLLCDCRESLLDSHLAFLSQGEWKGIRYIQAMLGHVRLDTTQIYTHVSIRMLKQVHAATHPAAQLNAENDLPPIEKPSVAHEETGHLEDLK